jgi:AraC-like DNA-binding protein
MIFVPVSFFATFGLLMILLQMFRHAQMAQRSTQLFAILIALYAGQSFLLGLRWGYEVDAAAIWIALLAPLLPITAHLAYQSLAGSLTWASGASISIFIINGFALFIRPDVADGIILLTYLGFGCAILRHAYLGKDALALVKIAHVDDAWHAMVLTGVALICSAVMDLFVIIDFIRTGGQNIGLWITLAQTGFIFAIGLAAVFGQSGASEDLQAPQKLPPAEITQEDEVIIDRLVKLFEQEALYVDTELNLRRMARRLGLPDRSVSRAINKTQKMSVSQFVNTFRVKDAAHLLTSSDQSILQISMNAGFLSKSNFNREFMRVMGHTPSQWRNQQKTL